MLSRPTTPTTQRLPAITCNRFSLIRFRSPLLTESRLFSLPVGTEMFHFPTFPPHALCVQARVTPHDWCGVPPFGHPRINARLAAPRGLSQPPTSFIGSWCQGIHRAPLKTWPHKIPTRDAPGRKRNGRAYKKLFTELRRCSRPLCSSQRTTSHRPLLHRRTPREAGGTTDGPVLNRDNGCPLPQDPTACLRPPAPLRLRSTHTRGVQYWEPAATPAAELVSVPPSSTTHRNQRSARCERTVMPWAWLP